jgi:hypothetical protein
MLNLVKHRDNFTFYSEIALSRKPFGIGHMDIYKSVLRMTDTMISQNIDPSSWDTLYYPIIGHG